MLAALTALDEKAPAQELFGDAHYHMEQIAKAKGI